MYLSSCLSMLSPLKYIPMKTNRKYLAPKIEVIQLDNEISLQLQSTPPEGPGESASLSTEYMKTNPFKTEIV